MTEKSFWDCKHLSYERDNEYVKQLGCQKTNNLCLKRVCNDFELNGDMERTNLEMDRNGYYVCDGISCPKCKSRLAECREVAYPNGEVYKKFDCIVCDFTGRLRKGNLYIDL